MTTNEATALLARLVLGEDPDEMPEGDEGRRAADKLMASDGIPYGQALDEAGGLYGMLLGANDLLGHAVTYGREWQWAQAGRVLRAAYVTLGATPPEGDNRQTGTRWHRGEHPIQIAMTAVRS